MCNALHTPTLFLHFAVIHLTEPIRDLPEGDGTSKTIDMQQKSDGVRCMVGRVCSG